MKKIVSILIFLLLYANSVFAATLEVGPGKTYSTIQAAVNVAQAGDEVLVDPGTYTETVTTQASGTSSQRITIRALNRATETGNESLWSTIDGEYNRHEAFVIAHSYWTVEGFHLTRHHHTIYREHATIDAEDGSAGLIAQYNLFENAYMLQSANQTFELRISGGSNARIRYNKFHAMETGIPSGSTMVGMAIECYYSTGIIVEYNEFRGYTTGIKFGGGNNTPTARYNYFHNIGSLGLYFRDFDGMTAHNNVFETNTGRHIYNQNHNNDVGHKIYNNTFITLGGGTASVFTSGTPTSDYPEVHDNIISGGVAFAWFTGQNPYLRVYNNIYYNANINYSANTDIGAGEQTVVQNPLESNYLSLFEHQDKGANLNVSVWPYQLGTGIQINSTSLPNGVIDTAYSQTLTALNGTTPYTWTIQSGSLPAGLSLSSAGVISGTPTTVANQNFTVRVTDSNSPTPSTTTKNLSIAISAPSPLQINTASLAQGLINTAYGQTLTASGGTPSYSWDLQSGSLPAGLSLSNAGVISGTPTTAETQSFTVQVTDSSSPTPETDTQNLSITIDNYTYTYLETESDPSQTSTSSPLRLDSDANASGGEYIYVVSGVGNSTSPVAEASYDVTISLGGNYYLWLLMYGPSGSSDALYIGFDGSYDRVSTSQWGNYEWVQVEVTHGSGNYLHALSQGAHQINIGHGEELARADRILVTNDLTFIPEVVLGNAPPSIDSYQPSSLTPSVNEGASLAFSVTASDVDSGSLTYSWTLDGSAVSSTSGYTYSPNYTAAGSHTVAATVSDGNSTDTQSWTVTVNAVNAAPTIDSYQPASVTPSVNEGASLAFSVTASDADSGSLSYSWTLDGSAVSSTSGYTYSPNYTAAGSHTVVATVSDGNSTDTQSWTVTVNAVDATPSIDSYLPSSSTPSVNEGASLAFSVTASDSDTPSLNYSWELDDSVVATVSSYTYSSGYTDAGSHTVVATVSDGNSTDTQNWDVTVNDRAAVIINENVPNTITSLVELNIIDTNGVEIEAWLVSEVNQDPAPLVSDSRWVTTKPTSYELLPGSGSKTLYLWLKDVQGNVSATAVSDSISLISLGEGDDTVEISTTP